MFHLTTHSLDAVNFTARNKSYRETNVFEKYYHENIYENNENRRAINNIK